LVKNMSELEIVIISWNTADLTRECLTSLYQELVTSGLSAEVWVVDNASSDDSVVMIEREFPQVKVIKNSDNVGFARANNQVLKQACAPYQILLNSDTVVHSESISRLVQFASENSDAAAVGPKLVYPDGVIQRSFTRLPSLFGELRYCLAYHFFPFNALFLRIFGFGDKSWKAAIRTQQVDVLSAACLLIRKEALDVVGLLAEDYFLFSEENDLFCRMKRAGLRSYYLPTATVTHVVGASRRKRGGLDSQVNFLKSRMIYFRRYHPSTFGFVRSIYGLFLGWSLVWAQIASMVKRKKDSEYVSLYRRLRETISEVPSHVR
jgi:N-acetylglucosaminyl-diphospho-decaprenol L-rhamnosyltransferase